MCGSAESGFGASRADLYVGSTTWVVAEAGSRWALPAIEALWRSVGSSPVATSSSEHDALMSFASHLPQFTATALAGTLEEAGLSASDLGPGGRDMTRLAASSPGMWRDIVALGFHPGLVEALRVLSGRARALANLIEERDGDGVANIMERTRRWKGGPP
jgi:prephenate dehydrogenase